MANNIISLRNLEPIVIQQTLISGMNGAKIFIDYRDTGLTSKTRLNNKGYYELFISKKSLRVIEDSDMKSTSNYCCEGINGFVFKVLEEFMNGEYTKVIRGGEISIIKPAYLESGIIPEWENMQAIAEIRKIPEMGGYTLLTSAYIIGEACMKAVYSDNKADEVSYTCNGQLHVISGEDLTKIAKMFVNNDIEVSGSLGYSYYNRETRTDKGNGSIIGIAVNNERRFQLDRKDVRNSDLIGLFREFVPLGFRWSGYAPLWCQSEEFINKIKNNTIFGADFFAVQNNTYKGNRIVNTSNEQLESITFYTTKKRIHQALGVNFDIYVYQFLNIIMYNLYLPDGMFNIDDAKSKQEAIVNDIIRPMWNKMTQEPLTNAKPLILTLMQLTMDSIKYDVETAHNVSTRVFSYID